LKNLSKSVKSQWGSKMNKIIKGTNNLISIDKKVLEIVNSLTSDKQVTFKMNGMIYVLRKATDTEINKFIE
jgi:hypothetical protein